MKARISFRAYHDSAPPADVSTALEVVPTHFVRAGDAFPIAPELGPIPRNGWFLNSAEPDDTGDLSEHLARVVGPLAEHAEGLSTLRSRGWDVDLFIAITFESTERTFSLSAQQLDQLATLDMEVEFGCSRPAADAT